ncbi:L,D-transpeptidase family protein [Rhodocytophaga aerolata]|uniref:L,D-transpeptidase family protein n=1 Tax=Rhodocytophaga aerolata TaxID=455078 RepID=A0ABT8QXZ9_9BACT|nr:L,D-transpeptidase family protein [Rhodocytophaga aerolata]MDO1444720.1 L,D-transpeptidase family protein [Rhodocytophaga aerolata]
MRKTFVRYTFSLSWLLLWLLLFAQCADKTKAVSIVKTPPAESKRDRNAADAHLFIQQQVEKLLMGEGIAIANDSIFSTNVLPKFYENRTFQPVWLDSIYVESILGLLSDADKEGLQKEDYHFTLLQELKKQLATEGQNYSLLLAQFDLLLTDALFHYSYHLLNGKVPPKASTSTWNYQAHMEGDTLAQTMQKAIDTYQVAAELEKLKPQIPNYNALKKNLAIYRELAKKGEFPKVPADSVLQLRTTRTAIAKVRKRLFMEGLCSDTLGITPAGADYYDDSLLVAVKRFQVLHALQADGILGKSTLQEMNVSVEDRIGQIRANLERLRWSTGSLTPDFIVVNIAGFELYLYHNNTLSWTTNVMTGAEKTETPVFKSTIHYLVFNPTWTVPTSIVKATVIPSIRKDSTYLKANQYLVRDLKGQLVDPDSINSKKVSSRNFPYTVIQTPGDHNALGRVKFMFPNEHAIYLHDTPSKHLFEKADRAFSHGCIRVQNPMKLAEILLADSLNWNQQKLMEVVATNTTKTVMLKKRMDILLMYWTAGIDPATGAVKFYRDIYKRDKQVLEALNKLDNTSLPFLPTILPVIMVVATAEPAGV